LPSGKFLFILTSDIHLVVRQQYCQQPPNDRLSRRYQNVCRICIKTGM